MLHTVKVIDGNTLYTEVVGNTLTVELTEDDGRSEVVIDHTFSNKEDAQTLYVDFLDRFDFVEDINEVFRLINDTNELIFTNYSNK